MTTWICGDCASLMARQTASISSRSARASAVTATLRISRAMRLHASNSPAEELGNPASMTSTPSFSSCLAMRSFEVAFRWKPGDCSPSRSVVSRMNTRFDSARCSPSLLSFAFISTPP